MFSLHYNPSVTLSRATSLYTREVFNERFANVFDKLKFGSFQGLFSAGTPVSRRKMWVWRMGRRFCDAFLI